MTFHNGEKLTAEDVKFTIDSILDPQVGSWLRGFLAPIKDVQVVDETHLKLKTDNVEAQLIPAFSYVDITPKSMGTDLAKAESGRLRAVQVCRVGAERPDRAGEERRVLGPGTRSPKVDKIIFKPVTEMQTRLSQVLAGNVDLVYDFSLSEVPRMQADKRVVVTLNPPAEQSFAMYLNMRKPPFDKVEMRQAMGLALDREAFFKNFQSGIGSTVGNSPFTDKHWAYEPKTAAAYKYDLDKVGQLLEKAGYPEGAGARLQPARPERLPGVQADLDDAPGGVRLDRLPAGHRRGRDRPVVAAPQPEPRVLRRRRLPRRGTADPALTYSAGLLYPPNAANIGGLTAETMPGYVEALKEGAQTTDQAKRKEAYSKVQMLWVEYLPGPVFGAPRRRPTPPSRASRGSSRTPPSSRAGRRSPSRSEATGLGTSE